MTSRAQNTLRFPIAAPPETSAAVSPRLPGLDWLRAAAALAVVALHAGMPYMTHPLPALEWSVRSTERSAFVDALSWAINGAVMPTFFLMGGCLAAGLWKRNPGTAFVAHRSRRLLGPLALGIVLVLPADMYVWLIGWFTQGLIPWRKVLSIKLPSPLSEQFWGVAHLWYLQCLWTLSIGAFVVLTIAQRYGWPGLERAQRAKPRGIHAERLSWETLAALSLASGLILAWDPTFLIGFQQTWWPRPAAIAFYGLFFAAGWNWRSPASLKKPGFSTTSPRAPLSHHVPPSPINFAVGEGRGEGPKHPINSPALQYPVPSTQFRVLHSINSTGRSATAARLAFAIALFPLLLSFLHRHIETPFTGLPLFGLTTLFAAYGWLVATGLFALARSHRAPAVPKSVAYVAEASFWMYLVHHPLAGLTQLALLNVPLSPSLKFAVTLATSVWLSLGTYAVLVRGTWIGNLLDGHGVSGRMPALPQQAPAKEKVRRAA